MTSGVPLTMTTSFCELVSAATCKRTMNWLNWIYRLNNLSIVSFAHSRPRHIYSLHIPVNPPSVGTPRPQVDLPGHAATTEHYCVTLVLQKTGFTERY